MLDFNFVVSVKDFIDNILLYGVNLAMLELLSAKCKWPRLEHVILFFGNAWL